MSNRQLHNPSSFQRRLCVGYSVISFTGPLFAQTFLLPDDAAGTAGLWASNTSVVPSLEATAGNDTASFEIAPALESAGFVTARRPIVSSVGFGQGMKDAGKTRLSPQSICMHHRHLRPACRWRRLAGEYESGLGGCRQAGSKTSPTRVCR